MGDDFPGWEPRTGPGAVSATYLQWFYSRVNEERKPAGNQLIPSHWENIR